MEDVMYNGKETHRVGTSNEDSEGDVVGEIGDISSQKHFSFWSTMGINFAAFTPPIAIGSYLAFSYAAGGSSVYVYGTIVTFIFQLFVCASMAELSAVYPHTGGKNNQIRL